MVTQAPTAAEIRDAWDRIAGGYDESTTPLNIPLSDRVLDRVGLRPGERFLDVASGSGALSIPAARRGARVTAVDISPTMIERLDRRARDEGLSELEGRVMDGYDLGFADASFDVAASQNGVSSFPDLARGLRELVRVVAPGGRVLIVAFGSLRKAEFLGFFLGAMQAATPGFAPPPMDPPPLPFQVSDPEVLHQRLTEAGLGDVSVEPLTWAMELRSAAHLWDVVTNSNPIAARLVADLTDDQRIAVQQVLEGMLRERSGGSPAAVLYSEMHIGTATR